ncbi:hypothetical protein [Pseudoflavitalea rhizosphaerae]|uniref:hypothetical protein n=1 Tax=Pseudoflavitalea rhizosphaerae TaxID=1884793 RepID=UPI000F8DB127|nr:hypothetical protein [Pseudoflavitalea rhizosphaerae]
MKSLKIVLASLFLSASVITMSSFVADYKSNAFAVVCYEYADGLGLLDPVEVGTTTNWAPITSASVPTACPNAEFLCVICFDDSQFTGTPADRKQQAIDVLKAWLQAGNSIQSLTDGQSINFSNKSLTVYQRDFE